MPDLVPPSQLEQLALPLPAAPLATAAAAADAVAARRLFTDYRARRAAETVRRQDADLACFASFLEIAAIKLEGHLNADPGAWAGVSWGIVAAFVAWQVQQGYAVGSINVRLATVKAYAKLATQAGAIPADEYAKMRMVPGYRHAEGRRVDAQRTKKRVGKKKAEPISVSRAQAAELKAQAAPLDALLMCLLLDHGLRVSEVASLVAGDFDLDRGALRFYRSKVDKTQTHRLSAPALAAARDALAELPPDAQIFGVDRTLRRKVGELGAAVGLPKLSPHDCRHAWATFATRAGTPLKALQDAGGWSSPAMPLRYAESAEVANDGVRLD